MVSQLVSDLINHTGVASNLVQAAIAQVAELLKKPEEKRDLSDFIVNQLGLAPVWEIIQSVGTNTMAQIMSEGMQLIMAGQDKLAQAQAIFAQLVSDLKDHGIQSAQAATSIVTQAIKDVAAILASSEKRDLADFIVNQLGLGSVWEEIQNLGSNTVAQLIQEGLQLLVSGKEVVAQAKEIFDKLVQDLINHTGTASGLVQAWEEIQNLGGNVVAQLLNEAMQLVFAGQDILAQAQSIFSQLVSDLVNHTGVASNLVQAAIAQV